MKKQGIQLLRVIACISVFLTHFGQRFGLQGTVRSVFDLGAYGVQLFYVISGFLACVSWEKKSDSITFGKSVLQYYQRRMARILPLYYFCILYFFLTETFLWKDVPSDSLRLYWSRYLFFLNAVVPSDGYFWGNIGLTWTIPVFVFFYLVFPFLHRICNSAWKSAFGFILFCGISLLNKRFFPGYFDAIGGLPIFLLGMCVYYSLKEQRTIALSLGAATAACGLFGFVGPAMGISGVFAILLFAADRIVIPHPFQSAVSLIDRYSFAIYLCHGIVFCGLLDKVPHPRYLTPIIAILGTAVLSVAVHHLIEEPCSKLLYKKQL